ncbi:potassium transporter 5 [Quercus suber]|uniref:Potassium transporter 5 n=1 Tax=Quercus suber TaxID=58331 RepID=A0AAW0KXX3_QUESU
MTSEVALKNPEPSMEQVCEEFGGKRILRRFDSLDLESSAVPGHHGHGSKAVGRSVILHLAFQSIGIVYGDIGTSPLYVYANTFTNGIKHYDDILGVLSLICYTLTLIPLFKYVFIVLQTNGNGAGGTFALYSLICRYAKVGLIPNQQAEDQEVSNFQLDLPSSRQWIASVVKAKLENSLFAKLFLLVATMLGTSCFICCGRDQDVRDNVQMVKTGHRESLKSENKEEDEVKQLLLQRSIQISMCSVTYLALILAYSGQATFLHKHNDLVKETFFKSIPEPLYWPMFVVAILASIVASQATISGTISMVQQSLSLGCFPQRTSLHTRNQLPSYVGLYKCHFDFQEHRKDLQCICSVEVLYLSSDFYKFAQGGYLPMAFAAVLMTIMYIWNDVHRRKYFYELDHKVSLGKLKDIATDTYLCRMPGLALFYSELVQGIPPIFKHYVVNVPTLHLVLVFVTIKSLPISKVPIEERFLFRRVEPKDENVFRCVVRYGT